jgi:hypothetical protein
VRLMAYGRGIGVRGDRCGKREVSDRGLEEVLGAQAWWEHVRSLHRNLWESRVEAFEPAQRSEYLGDRRPMTVEARRRRRTRLPLA